VITAVDSSVLLDVFGADPSFGPRSRDALRQCIHQGRLVACDAVWAEIVGVFPSADEAREAMDRLGVEFSGMELEAALEAGRAWKRYRARGGRRERVTADFLIGAHALRQAERLLTRDRGFYRGYFAELVLLDPGRS
jgi:hypothetical protein